MTAPAPEPKVDLKNRYLAALLSFLIPGAGQLYQRRHFKAGVFFCGIMLLSMWGMQMGDWKIMYRLEASSTSEAQRGHPFDPREDPHEPFNPPRDRAPSRTGTRSHWGYFAQAPVGIFTLISHLQERRYYSEKNIGAAVEGLSAEQAAEGFLSITDVARNDAGQFETRRVVVRGSLRRETRDGEFGREEIAIFTGETDAGVPVEFLTSSQIQLDAPIAADSRRYLSCPVNDIDAVPTRSGEFHGWIDRGWFDRFLVPPDALTIERLHYNLGKKLTLAEVFTWIAGMLNVLVIWDALAGPAYGYRRRPFDDGDQTGSTKSTEPAAAGATPSAPAPASAEVKS